METPTDAVRLHYYGVYDPTQPDEVMIVDLYGAKRWHEDGWVYRLDGDMVVADDSDPYGKARTYYYDNILVYVVQGHVVAASEPSFWDIGGEREYTWEDLEHMISNYEFADDDDEVDPITDEEIMYVYQEFENDDEDDESETDEGSFDLDDYLD